MQVLFLMNNVIAVLLTLSIVETSNVMWLYYIMDSCL